MYLIESAWEEMGDTESNLRSKATAVQPTYKINMLQSIKHLLALWPCGQASLTRGLFFVSP